jgi:hypothetical protein
VTERGLGLLESKIESRFVLPYSNKEMHTVKLFFFF